MLALGAEQVFSSEVRDRYGLPAQSSVHMAVDALVCRGLLTREEESIRFDSPFALGIARSGCRSRLIAV
jgi:hypothetical protein